MKSTRMDIFHTAQACTLEHSRWSACTRQHSITPSECHERVPHHCPLVFGQLPGRDVYRAINVSLLQGWIYIDLYDTVVEDPSKRYASTGCFCDFVRDAIQDIDCKPPSPPPPWASGCRFATNNCKSWWCIGNLRLNLPQSYLN
jgi:hypothetical protein